MTNLEQVNVTPRDKQVLNLLVQGCSNKEIGEQVNIGLCTANITFARCFLRAEIFAGRKPVKLARCVYEGDRAVTTPCASLSPTESQISILVWEGLTNDEIVGTGEQMIKNHLRSPFDDLESGVGWNWQCAWPAVAETVGCPRPGAVIHRAR